MAEPSGSGSARAACGGVRSSRPSEDRPPGVPVSPGGLRYELAPGRGWHHPRPDRTLLLLLRRLLLRHLVSPPSISSRSREGAAPPSSSTRRYFFFLAAFFFAIVFTSFRRR